jgi:hypothetical protein
MTYLKPCEPVASSSLSKVAWVGCARFRHTFTYVGITPCRASILYSSRVNVQSHFVGSIVISTNREPIALCLVVELVVDIRDTGNSANLRDGRDEHGVGSGKVVSGSAVFLGFLIARTIVERCTDEIRLKPYWVRMSQRTKSIFLSALSV